MKATCNIQAPYEYDIYLLFFDLDLYLFLEICYIKCKSIVKC